MDMVKEYINLDQFCKELNKEENEMYDARDRAIDALQRFVEDNGGEITFDDLIPVKTTDYEIFDVEAVRICSRGKVCFVSNGGNFSFLFLDILEIFKLLCAILEEISPDGCY